MRLSRRGRAHPTWIPRGQRRLSGSGGACVPEIQAEGGGERDGSRWAGILGRKFGCFLFVVVGGLWAGLSPRFLAPASPCRFRA